MRHRKNFNHLSRKTAHRKAMLANMANSLIIHKRITTTTAKAKALRMYVEPLITRSKEDTTHSRRVVFSHLQDKDAVSELFRDVAPKIINRPGGYTRILKTGNRLGDAADMCIMELVDYNENMLAGAGESKSGRSRRRRGGAKKKDSSEAPQTETAEVKTEQSAPKKEEGSVEEITQQTITSEEQEEASEVKNETSDNSEAGGEEQKKEEEDKDNKEEQK